MSSDPNYMREYMRRYSAQRRQKVIDLLGGACSVCGATGGLEVHHVDPKTKSFSLASRWHRKWSDIEAELPKCILLCDPCHTNQHRSVAPCGTPQRYWRGCRCVACTAANAQHHREYKTSRMRP